MELRHTFTSTLWKIFRFHSNKMFDFDKIIGLLIAAHFYSLLKFVIPVHVLFRSKLFLTNITVVGAYDKIHPFMFLNSNKFSCYEIRDEVTLALSLLNC